MNNSAFYLEDRTLGTIIQQYETGVLDLLPLFEGDKFQ